MKLGLDLLQTDLDHIDLMFHLGKYLHYLDKTTFNTTGCDYLAFKITSKKNTNGFKGLQRNIYSGKCAYICRASN